jgi:hypothetical protein
MTHAGFVRAQVTHRALCAKLGALAAETFAAKSFTTAKLVKGRGAKTVFRRFASP